jgi:HEAT repeat protein
MITKTPTVIVVTLMALLAVVVAFLKGGDAARKVACAALGNIGPAAKEALPALRDSLNDADAQVRRQAQAAIGKIQNP